VTDGRRQCDGWLQCVEYVDETVLAELVPRLTELIRAGVGLGTKVSSTCHSLINDSTV